VLLLRQVQSLKSKFLYTLLFLLIPTAVIAVENEEIEAWLQKMHKAAHMQNYSGKFVYQQGKQLSLMKIIHASGKDGEYERLISLDDVGREIIRSKGTVTCILPDSKSVVVEKARPEQQFPPKFPMKISHLKNQYRFMLDKIESVAGRRSQKIVIAPSDSYRYGHRLWIDNETGLLLKTHLIDEDGQLLEQFMFTQIEFMDVIPDKLLKPRTISDAYTWYQAEPNKQTDTDTGSDSGWIAKQLPAGFDGDMDRSHNMPNKKLVRHLVFTDGLASVSIFIERSQKRSANLVGSSRIGAVNAYGRLLNGYYVTAVGEVPNATVKLIGESVVYEAP